MNRSVLTRSALAGVATVALALTGCSSGDPEPGPSGSTDPYAQLTGEIVGTGATFPDAFYQAVIEAFVEVAPDANVTYTGSGSSAGRADFTNGLSDIAGTDSLVREGQEGNPAAGEYLYIPTVAAPITVSYNLPDVSNLQLSAQALAGIFQSEVTTWNHELIQADNPGVTLPDTQITIVVRDSGSGTSNNFVGFLNLAAPDVWQLGRGDSPDWPAGRADWTGVQNLVKASGNSGVATAIKETPGAIGYVDFSAASDAGLTFASIKNKAGVYVAPSLEGATAAVAGAALNPNLSYEPLNAEGTDAYPITAPTYLLARTSYPDAEKGALVKGFLTFILTEGQELAAGEHYAKLPESLRQQALAAVSSITVG